ncbi:MAG: amidohydrolase [Myxococcota bacterium]
MVAGLWFCSTTRERTLYVGGPILTMEDGVRQVSALAVDGERIAGVGDEAQWRKWAASNKARIVDLEGRALLPGFIDAHGHFPGTGLEVLAADLQSPPVGDLRSLDELVERLRQRAGSDSGDDWVAGFGYDDTLLAEKRHPTRHDLDRVSTERPVIVVHVSGHLASTNGAGLARLGIDRDTPDPEGGRIRRDPATGEPDGVLEETAMEAVMAEIYTPSPLEAVRMIRRAVELTLASGTTTVQAGFADALQVRSLPWMSRLGLIPLRLVIWPNAEASDALLAGELDPPDADSEWVSVGATKLVADGSIQGYTGYLSEPYTVPPGDDPGFRGYPRIAREELFAKVARYHDAGRQLAIHGNGDASIEDILDAIEAAQAKTPRADPRSVLIHAQMARPDQLERMRSLGIIPSFFSLHTYYWGDRHRDVFLGPERAARISPAATAARLGLRFTLHCDAPVVPHEPLRLVWAAVNRRTAGGDLLGPEQRIDAWRALQAVTIDAARQHFQDSLSGSLAPGKWADLVILDRSPLDDPAHIDEIRVLETIVAGETRWKADDAE